MRFPKIDEKFPELFVAGDPGTMSLNKGKEWQLKEILFLPYINNRNITNIHININTSFVRNNIYI